METHKINSIDQLVRYFSSLDRYVTASEFVKFWHSLTFEEKMYYRTLDLETGLPRQTTGG
jgi:hypothetical protein